MLRAKYPLLLILSAGLLFGLAACKRSPVEPPPPILVVTPVLSPAGGNLLSGEAITITCADTLATIRYTLDGGEPNELSTAYTGPLILSEIFTNYLKNGVLKARAFKPQAFPSRTASGRYTLDLPELPASFTTVSGGTFNNGTSNITVSGFYMDKYELTQAGYQAVMGVNPSEFTGLDTRPVERVSWFDAIEYCNRRSIQEGLTPCYRYGVYGFDPTFWPTEWKANDANHAYIICDWAATGFRLPTEMEWMFAALGGNSSLGYTYSGSNNLDEVGLHQANWGNIYGTTGAVGSKAPNELGLYDLSGNVFEMVWDCMGPYPAGNYINPHGTVYATSQGEAHVIRGGCWQSFAEECTLDWRGERGSTSMSRQKGFRVVRIIP